MKKVKSFSIFIALFLMFISFADTKVYADENETVILGGTPFGIKMFSQGVMVVKTEAVKTNEGAVCPAEEAGIKINDIIISANGASLTSNEDLSEIIEKSIGQDIDLTIKRENKSLKIKIRPVLNKQGIYKAGIWVKDSAAGIGTITFYSENAKGFCGLGHGICESSTGMMIPIAYGEVDNAYIASVTKSRDSQVGSLNGYFTKDTIGTALLNCSEGIYGETCSEITGARIELADKEEVKTGEAFIYTTVSGEQPEYYEAEILRVNKNSNDTDIIIKITDEELTEKTGGIVQGMSGSPIIQNNKLVGAVTHVIVDDVDCGYGIFAERMFETLAEICK